MMSIVKLISDKLNSSIENKGSGSLVVSGGSSPISIYEELSNIDISWSRVFLTLVDDRLVAPDHKDSNQKLLHNYFIKNKAKNINFFPLTENFLSNTEFKKKSIVDSINNLIRIWNLSYRSNFLQFIVKK